jgi:hypothetical protein
MRYLFQWSGELIGFIDENGALFDQNGWCLGHVDRSGTAWCNDGQYLGELIHGEYILRNSARLPPPPTLERPPTLPPSPLPPVVAARTPRRAIPGWIDPFDSMLQPQRESSPLTSKTLRKFADPVGRAGTERLRRKKS